MKKIKLNRRLYAFVDDQDFETVKKYHWYANRARNTYYAITTYWDKRQKKYKTLLMHHLVAGKRHGKVIDHINHLGYDNRRCNLRFCTISENCMNFNEKKLRPNNSSGILGVSRHKMSGKWEARIRIKKKKRFLGLFKTKMEASIAYRNARQKHHLAQLDKLPTLDEL